MDLAISGGITGIEGEGGTSFICGADCGVFGAPCADNCAIFSMRIVSSSSGSYLTPSGRFLFMRRNCSAAFCGVGGADACACTCACWRFCGGGVGCCCCVWFGNIADGMWGC